MSEINYNAVKCFDSKVSPALYNRLVDIVQAQGIEPGIGYQLTRSTLGTTLRIKAAGANGSSTPPEPFDVTVSPVSGDATSINVNVRPGTVNQIFPDNLFSPITVDASGMYYAKLTCDTDGQNITSISFAVDDTAPEGQSATPNALPSSLDIALALIQNSTVYQTQNGSLMAFGTQSFTVDADPPAQPGQLTFTPYFVWNISAV